MTDALLRLSNAELRDLSSALKSGRVSPPYSSISVERIVPRAAAASVCEGLRELENSGLPAAGIAQTLEMVLSDRARRIIPEELLQLVITGPDAAGAVRDTSVVVRELFATAQRSVLVAGYAVYQGQRVFQALANRMEELKDLKVRFFLDVRRGPRDTSIDSQLLRRFRNDFANNQWPAGCRLPQLFYFTPSLGMNASERFALHAKCVAADEESVFISSANFTEAAQNRNIEIGLLVRSEALARRITNHFDGLIATRVLKQVP